MSQSAARVEQLAAIATRPEWNVERDTPGHATTPARQRCEATDCGREAAAYLLVPGRAYCRGHAAFARQKFPERRIVSLVDCARCSRRCPFGLSLRFEGENGQAWCRVCAELVRELIEERT
jgi:hypothetical protein